MTDSLSHISFGQFGDMRDDPGRAIESHMYQPPGSKMRFELENNRGSVTARRLGPPDSILPGGRPTKAIAGYLGTWGGGTGTEERFGEGHREIMSVGVKKGYQGKGLGAAMLRVSNDWHTAQGHSLSHSTSLSDASRPADAADGIRPGRDGRTFASRYPLPGDKYQ